MSRSRRTIAIVTTAGVAVGIGDMPYGYYSLLRLAVCGFSLYLLFGSEPVTTEWQRWMVGATGVLYNPILPVRIGDKDIWIVLNIATVVLFWTLAVTRPERVLKREPPTAAPPARIQARRALRPESGSREEVFFQTAKTMLEIQLISSRLKDQFGMLMTNPRARGYVFGFHDGLLFKLGLRDESNRGEAVALMKKSYERIFGEQAAYVLFDRSLAAQSDPDFQDGQMTGGNEIVEFIDKKVPPLGLGRIAILGLER